MQSDLCFMQSLSGMSSCNFWRRQIICRCIACILKNGWLGELDESESNTAFFKHILGGRKNYFYGVGGRRQPRMKADPYTPSLPRDLWRICMHSNSPKIIRYIKKLINPTMRYNPLFDHDQISALYERLYEMGNTQDLRQSKWMDLYVSLSLFFSNRLENGLCVAVPCRIYRDFLQNLLWFGSNRQYNEWLRFNAKCDNLSLQLTGKERRHLTLNETMRQLWRILASEEPDVVGFDKFLANLTSYDRQRRFFK